MWLFRFEPEMGAEVPESNLFVPLLHYILLFQGPGNAPKSCFIEDSLETLNISKPPFLNFKRQILF